MKIALGGFSTPLYHSFARLLFVELSARGKAGIRTAATGYLRFHRLNEGEASILQDGKAPKTGILGHCPTHFPFLRERFCLVSAVAETRELVPESRAEKGSRRQGYR
jgi:hypothetical protein